ncbi:MAG: hypothetical protein ABJF10_00275 [Chthoniobacter sp.]|uniref:hypothetical protein n=1 Tax=Chthoniobacter sp. TaxID=2510640 RepID=UPI0032AA72B9
MNPGFSQTGGARLDYFNATFPFATLSADADGLHLSCMGHEYLFPKDKIRRLSRHRGIFSVGLRIEHSEPSFPQFVVFWASVFFWTSGFQALTTQLESLGYDIHPKVA